MLRLYHKVFLLACIAFSSTFLFFAYGRNYVHYPSALQPGAKSETRNQQIAQLIPDLSNLARPVPDLPPSDELTGSRIQVRPQPHTNENIPKPSDDIPHISKTEIDDVVESINNLDNGLFYRTECETQYDFPKRYQHLKDLAESHRSSKIKYFFALDLYQARDLLPRLLGTILQVARQLGPSKCAISIVEGRSTDGTYEILEQLREKIEESEVRYYLQRSEVDPHGADVDRIFALSELRNMALSPLIEGSKKGLFDKDTITMFINDVSCCTEDIYELIHQHIYQGAAMTCAMDWTDGGQRFYDSWVSRSMSGDLFFEVPQDVSWAFHKNLFWDHALSREKFEAHQPFQVYACWGGMITLNSAPFISQQIRIRNSTDGECYNGEPTNLGKDLWALGLGRIATVPSVSLGYSNSEGSRIKHTRGWVHDYVDLDITETGDREKRGTEKIKWSVKPPGQVKCIPYWGHPVSWVEP